MNDERDEMERLFGSVAGEWDTEEPLLGHRQRFMDKLSRPKKTYNYRKIWFAAASLLLIAGTFALYEVLTPKPEITVLSAEATETQLYFKTIIKTQVAELQKESDPESQKMLSDALVQMASFDKDYEKLVKELQSKGETQKILYAMITNLQTRISFLENVAIQIEKIKQIKSNYHEKNTL